MQILDLSGISRKLVLLLPGTCSIVILGNSKGSLSRLSLTGGSITPGIIQNNNSEVGIGQMSKRNLANMP